MFCRKTLFAAAVLAIGFFPAVCQAQAWAEKMFKVKKHDFGTVAAGVKSVYEFEFQNMYKEDVHVRGVRSSCGCATVSVKNSTLKSWEKGAIVAKFNTDRFRGSRSATITVLIDQPFRAEVQLQVKGNIRGDVSITPGIVQFDEVKSLTPKTKVIRVTKYGNRNWRIEDVRSTYTHVAVRLKQIHRGRDSVSYDMSISTTPTAPEGFIQNELLIVTNDRYNRQIPVSMTGKIVSQLQMSPNVVTFSSLKPGETATKKVLLKSDQPFEISDVICEDKNFTVTSAEGAKKLHFLQVSYQAPETVGEVRQNLKIITNISEHPIQLPVVVDIATVIDDQK